MIFQTQNQLNSVLIFIFFGIVLGLVFSLINLIFLIKYLKNPIKTILNTIFYSFFGIFFAILLIFYNFGNFSLTLLTFFLIAFFISSKHTSKSLVFIEKRWYNKFRQISNQFQRKRKTKSNEQRKKS